MDTDTRYSLAELARVTGVTPRTVRFYIAQGLLPSANATGPGATYDERHLARLRLIRRLQTQHLPLAEIRNRLAGVGDDEIGELLRVGEPEPGAIAETSALDYIRGVLGTPRREAPSLLMRVTASPPSAPAPAAHVPAAPAAAAQVPTAPVSAALRRAWPAPRLMRPLASETDVVSGAANANADVVAPMTAEIAAGAQPASTERPAPQRSQWDRIGLTPDIELHVRRPLSRQDNRRLERLITIARQVLGEEQP